MGTYLLSIDVGTGSVRAALVTVDGHIVALNQAPIIVWKSPGRMEQSSDNIWQTLVHVVNQLLNTSKVTPTEIIGMGIDSTASLVLLDKNFAPVFLPGHNQTNIIGWMDHRAIMQAEVLSQQHPHLLKGMGTRLIPELPIPRLLWLKQEAPDLWNNTGCIFDLYDFLTWKCTGIIARNSAGISSLNDNDQLSQLDIDAGSKLQGQRCPIATVIGTGLNETAAKQLGLQKGTPVATGIVDGAGGTLSTLLADHNSNVNQLDINIVTRRLSMVVGTSAVYVATSKFPVETPFFWGPWPSEFDGYYKYVIRQTAAGALIDHTLQSHPAFIAIQNMAISEGISVYLYLHQMLEDMAGNNNLSLLAESIHVLPYFAGNHCPRMDFSLRGVISGLTLDNSEQSLALVYLATIQSLALGARHNTELLKDSGHDIDLLMAAGGLAKNKLFMQEHVNAMNIPAALPDESDVMLLSGALVASVAVGVHPTLENAMRAMTRYRKIISPDTSLSDYMDKKYQVFLEMYEDQMKYRRVMRKE